MRISGIQVQVTDSEILDYSGRGAVFFGGSFGSLISKGTKIMRGFNNDAFTAAVFVDGTGTAHTVNGSNNLYCSEGVSPSFTAVVSSACITGTAITGQTITFCPPPPSDD